MLSYGIVDALLSELQFSEGGAAAAEGSTTNASTSTVASTNASYNFNGGSLRDFAAPNFGGDTASALYDFRCYQQSAAAPPALYYGRRSPEPLFAAEEYEDVLLVSVSPDYELDKQDVEHVFSILGDLKGQVSIVCGHRAIVKVTAGQGATIAAILDGHSLHGIPGSLRVALIDTKLVTPPASPIINPSFTLPRLSCSSRGGALAARHHSGYRGRGSLAATLSGGLIGSTSYAPSPAPRTGGDYNPVFDATPPACALDKQQQHHHHHQSKTLPGSAPQSLRTTTTADSYGSASPAAHGGELSAQQPDTTFQTPPATQRRPGRKFSLQNPPSATHNHHHQQHHGSNTNAVRKWTARYEIQVPTDNNFQVIERSLVQEVVI